MKIENVSIKNFRLLKDIPSLSFDEDSTVIVGRNNSGKTSLTELFKRLLCDANPSFSIDDFNIESHGAFWNAFVLKQKEQSDPAKIRKLLPKIETTITISYDPKQVDFGPLGEFIIDLNPDSTTAIAAISYELKDGEIDSLFEDIDTTIPMSDFFKIIRERIPKLYSAKLTAIDPNDATNVKEMSSKKLGELFQAGFINAQRGLDDTTRKENDVLGKVLGKLFEVAESENATIGDQSISKNLKDVVLELQSKIDTDFNHQLDSILPALQLFGYPGLTDPNISTETTLDVERLLENHTRVCYKGDCGINLPETYNGLGSRNLIYILFHLYQFFKTFQATQTTPGIQLVFIEEPEAHLHPQMQEVFICQLHKIAEEFAKKLNGNVKWPVQFVVTTHSTHIANKAPFNSIRYFFPTNDKSPQTIVKDVKNGFTGDSAKEDREFLHKYLTLTKCDMFFADKAILIEGPTERILLPRMIEKIDDGQVPEKKLGSQYLSVVEIGGAYAHHFYPFLDFLQLKTLIVTDIDSVKKISPAGGHISYPSCPVSEGTKSCNAGINKWFGDLVLIDLLMKTDKEKESGFRRIAYQIPESVDCPCGRSFEDAFMLANQELFGITAKLKGDKEKSAYELAKDKKDDKTNFAIEYAIGKTEWSVPRYIKEGLEWLREKPVIVPSMEIAPELERKEGSDE